MRNTLERAWGFNNSTRPFISYFTNLEYTLMNHERPPRTGNMNTNMRQKERVKEWKSERETERERPRPGPVSRPTRLMRMQSDNVRSKSKYKVGSTQSSLPACPQVSHLYLFQSLSSIRKLGRQRVRKQGNNSNLSICIWYFRICQAHTLCTFWVHKEKF